MSIFDTLSQYEDKVVSSTTILSMNKKGIGVENTKINVDPEVQKARLERFQKARNSQRIFDEKRKLQQESTIFPNTRRQNTITTETKHNFTNKNEISKYLNSHRVKFENALKKSLFMNCINSIAVESLVVDQKVKDEDGVRQFMYEASMDMFDELESVRNFDVVVNEGKVPGFVAELWSLASDVASYEGVRRFDLNEVLETCGTFEDKIQAKVAFEMSNISIDDLPMKVYFEGMVSNLMLENSEVIDKIKGKVSNELKRYKESAEKITDLKEAFKGKIDDVKTAEKPESEEPNDTGTDDLSNPDSGDTTDDKSSANPDDPNTKDDTSNTDSNENPDAGNTEEPSNDGESPADNTDPVVKNKDDGTNNEDDSLMENQDRLHKLEPKITAEIDDAASFATNYSHTFNTGDEKFEAIRKRLADDMVKAMDANDVERMSDIRSSVDAMAAKLDIINRDTNNKYGDMASKLADMSKSATFEINRRIEQEKTTTESGRSVFQTMVLQLATKKLKNEAAVTRETVEVNEGMSKRVINEAVIWQTILETFNTLRIIDSRDPVAVESFREFITELKK